MNLNDIDLGSMTSDLIAEFGQFLVGGYVFGQIQTIVDILENAELTGAEKKKIAVEELIELGVEVEHWLVRTAIEVAVGWVKARVAEAMAE